MIVDQYQRRHDYLRISLTDNCNLRCFYCMPEEDYVFSPAAGLMTHDEVLALAETFVREGVRKIRLTGGEPLVRKDAAAIIRSLGALPVTLTMTTNGTRLHSFLPVIREAGIRSLNISLDTLDADKFRLITRRDQHALVLRNIALMLENDIAVKINVVAMKGFNEDEVNRFVAWTRDLPIEVRFIEFMPFTGNRWTSNQVLTQQELLDLVGTQYAFEARPGMPHDTARHYQVPGHAGSFAIISTMTAPFCSTCNRMRLTADGKLKNCLFSAGETDLLGALRAGQDVGPLIHQNIADKARELGGQFTASLAAVDALAIQNRSMITIGG